MILRAHPYTSQNPASARQLGRLTELLAADRARSGRQHVFGAAASRELTLAECVNRSDALVSDVSGVISDYLYSGKPYAVTDMVDYGDRFAELFPLAGSGYVLRRDMANVDEVLAALLGHRPAGIGPVGHPEPLPGRLPRRVVRRGVPGRRAATN